MPVHQHLECILVAGRDALRQLRADKLAVSICDGCGCIDTSCSPLRRFAPLDEDCAARVPGPPKETGHSEGHRVVPRLFNFYSDLRYSTRSVFSRRSAPSLS